MHEGLRCLAQKQLRNYSSEEGETQAEVQAIRTP